MPLRLHTVLSGSHLTEVVAHTITSDTATEATHMVCGTNSNVSGAKGLTASVLSAVLWCHLRRTLIGVGAASRPMVGACKPPLPGPQRHNACTARS